MNHARRRTHGIALFALLAATPHLAGCGPGDPARADSSADGAPECPAARPTPGTPCTAEGVLCVNVGSGPYQCRCERADGAASALWACN